MPQNFSSLHNPEREREEISEDICRRQSDTGIRDHSMGRSTAYQDHADTVDREEICAGETYRLRRHAKLSFVNGMRTCNIDLDYIFRTFL